MQTMREFVKGRSIGLVATPADENPDFVYDPADECEADWMRAASHYVCVLRRGRKTMTVNYSMGPAHAKAPTAAQLLNCLADDAASFENSDSFESWCGEYGYSTDSIRALKIYTKVEEQAGNLREFLGEELYRELLWETGRL